MSKQVRSKLWFIRVDGPWEHLKLKSKDVKGWIDYSGCIIGYHNGDKEVPNPHLHMCLMLRSELQKQSLDTRVKKLFGVAKGGYSSKVWDGNLGRGAVSYLLHDPKGEIDDSIGLTPDQWASLKLTNEVIQEEITKAKEKASHKVIDYVLEKITESGEKWDAERIYLQIIKGVWNRMFYDPGDFQLQKYIDEILIRQCENENELTAYAYSRMMRLAVFKK